MSVDFKRRGFLTAGFSSLMVSGASAGDAHPLQGLKNVETGREYSPDDRFPIVLAMTAQPYYASCGEAFIGVQAALDNIGRERFEPVLIMPNVQDQLDPESVDNLISATTVYKDAIGFTILTGDLDQIAEVSQRLQGAFELSEGKVTGHTLDGFVLSPDGGIIDRRRADNYLYDWGLLREKIDDYCPGRKILGMCLG